MSDSLFILPQYQNAISTIYPATQLQVFVADTAKADSQKETYNISVEQLSTANLLQIRLCETSNPSHMLVSTIDQSLFERIKFEQSLNVSFIDFVQHLHKILDSATKRSDLHASLNTNLNCITLQFFERRSFRNLVHLSLPIEEPSERFVLHHMLHSLAAAQHKSDANALQLQRIQLDLSQRDAQCNDLRLELAAQSARLHDEQQRQHSHHAERTQRLEAELKNAHDAREADDRKHRQVVKTLQNALDAKTREEQVTAERLAAEAKRSELTRVEAQQIRHELRIAHEETERARTEMTAQKTIAGRLEQQLTESRDGERRARNEVLAQEKQRSELQAELEAEKHIARTKRMALELATEEISRANSIIVRQAKELGAVVKKCEWRTEVALKQEQRMKKLEEELVALQSRLRRNVEANEDNENVGGELKQLREATDQMNRKYGRKIEELRKQLNHIGAESGKLQDSTDRYLNRQ